MTHHLVDRHDAPAGRVARRQLRQAVSDILPVVEVA